MAKKSYPLSKVYGLLEPGPVVLVSTQGKTRPNIMNMSWHTMMEFEPPMIGCVISSQNYTFSILKATKECVINIPTVEIAKQVVGVGNSSGLEINKFEVFRLTPGKAKLVQAPMIEECYANLECKVVDTKLVSKYNFFILEVVKAWINPFMKVPRTIHHQGKGRFIVSGETIKLPSKMK
jgi:flavin reductase (DIM6/NTAB) family NADH-FMN oxidoreductase RutF